MGYIYGIISIDGYNMDIIPILSHNRYNMDIIQTSGDNIGIIWDILPSTDLPLDSMAHLVR